MVTETELCESTNKKSCELKERKKYYLTLKLILLLTVVLCFSDKFVTQK